MVDVLQVMKLVGQAQQTCTGIRTILEFDLVVGKASCTGNLIGEILEGISGVFLPDLHKKLS